MIDKDKITHRHWSIKVGRADPQTAIAPDTYGEIVTAVEDLSQSITNLILTPKGSVPTEPEKGVDILGSIDRHPDIGIPYLTREIWDAITLWEPRVTVERVDVNMVQFSHFQTQVFWRPVQSVLDDLQVTEVVYNG
ncbi:GPW/gp25 family protein [Agrobacterium pusense]|uniref:GPW/gp25 family protein n=1 Tax=Agrobacterium pusense TaxID=648995 RepID=UPI0010AE8B75|nr:GPW/gp25 family protein [Agrobacterium pusense]WCK24613.1 GPW/gp25 family protein [Agrobacterium pusense]